jgi:hypothetical protein
MSNAMFRNALWWLCLLVAPVVLLTIELFHPAGFTRDPGMYAYLSVPQPYSPQHFALGYFGPQWWFTLHMIQTPMVGLVAVGLWLLAAKVADADGPAAIGLAWLSRAATFVFLIYYTALDAIGGFGLAKSIELTEQLASSGQLTPAQKQGVELVLNQTWVNPWVGGVGSFVSLTGSWAVFFGALLLALALLVARKAPWPVALLLVGFGYSLQTSHTMPYGPIAFALLIFAALWLKRSERRSTAKA